MNPDNNILGCFVSGPSVNWDDDQESKCRAQDQAALFRTYIWGDNGISKILKTLNRSDYGNDVLLILLQFYVNPLAYELQNLKEIGSYRKKEKSIGITIVVNNENFFSGSEAERRSFLRTSIFQKLQLLERLVKKMRLDTNIAKLMSDLEGAYG